MTSDFVNALKEIDAPRSKVKVSLLCTDIFKDWKTTLS